MNDGADMDVHISMPSQKVGNPRCEEITTPMCRGIGYNMTKFPNEMNHETQEEAGLEVHQFWPLVEIKCSPDLKFFLCSMYTPICIEDYHKPLPVCRSVCERARKGCEPIMEKYSFKWPERMICENLPKVGETENLCMEHPSYSEDEHSSTNDNYNQNYNNNNMNNKKHHGGSSTTGQKKCPKGDKKCQAAIEAKGKDCACKCRYPLVQLGKESIWYNTTVGKVGSVNSCGIPCKGKKNSIAIIRRRSNRFDSRFRSFFLARRKGLCQLLDCAVVRFLCRQHIHDPHHFSHRHRALQVPGATDCLFIGLLFYGVDGLLDPPLHRS